MSDSRVSPHRKLPPFGALALIAPLVCALTCASALAQTAPELDLSGSMRVRYENIDGQARAGFNASDDLLSTRLRLRGDLDFGAVRFGAELFDSRAFQEDDGTPLSSSEVNAAELVQAFVAADFDAPWGGEASVQAGRFMLNLGSRRIVASDDTRNTTNGYTGVRLDWRSANRTEATLFYTLPQVRRPGDLASLRDADIEADRASDDQIFYGAIVTLPALMERALLQGAIISFRESDRGDTPTRDRELDTISLRAFRAPANNAWDFDVEAFAQTGSISASSAANAPRLDVSAWAGHAEIGRRFDASWTPRVSLAADYVSGDEAGGDFGRFDTLFGMRSAEFGPSGLHSAVGRANIASVAARVEAAPNARLSLMGHVRGLWLAEDTDSFSTSGVRDTTGASGDYAGTLLEGRARYWLAPDRVRLDVSGVYLAKGEFLETAPNISSGEDTIYTGIDLIFQF